MGVLVALTLSKMRSPDKKQTTQKIPELRLLRQLLPPNLKTEN